MSFEHLYDFALDRAKQERDELGADYRAIDAKSQGAGAIAAALAAAALVFLRNSQFSLGWVEALLFCVMLVLLTATVVLALLATFVARTGIPFGSAELFEEIVKVKRERDAPQPGAGSPTKVIADRLEGIKGDVLPTWVAANISLASACNRKAAWLYWAQITLFAALAFPPIIALTVLVLEIIDG
ncbi:MAG: hypothetical protein K0M70_02135 [Arenimonas sp.]|uniref:hypothetical protein n=1 Tax=Arenimonas sp. TaxID=1872635 RepID=UPI0025BB21A4|nr:hypothetical protein [Arenimonas sp.]MBW8366642.1 hypothetical protein [Arenimonas sp.]